MIEHLQIRVMDIISNGEDVVLITKKLPVKNLKSPKTISYKVYFNFLPSLLNKIFLKTEIDKKYQSNSIQKD